MKKSLLITTSWKKSFFFFYDLKNNKVIDKGIVANGSGSETRILGNLEFSNVLIL